MSLLLITWLRGYINMSNIILENQDLKLEILNPMDMNDEHFYTRYNYCGYIRQIYHKKKGIPLLGIPTDSFHPFHGEGFPDEFELPLCYESTEIGNVFLKIGVGLEEKKHEGNYSNWDMHPVRQRAATRAEFTTMEAIFTQTAYLNEEVGYQYEKTVALGKDSCFYIRHRLMNNGNLKWKTLWYSHCFLALPEEQKGVLVKTTSNCFIRENSPSFAHDGSDYRLVNVIKEGEGECLNWDIKPGLPNFHSVNLGSDSWEFVAEGDYPYHELQLYSNHRIISPEPKIIIELDRGESYSWATKYSIL